ncbi:MAG TPA: hypothetical protein VFI22_11995, partial [Thermomicrobiales bacterium]|nr:hypothetical protein [Thermomicrobiales bacterium]
VLKGALAAAASIPAIGGVETLAKKHRKRRKPLRCSGDSCDGTGGKRCGKSDTCQCYLHAKGGHVCASSRSSSCDATCDSDRDCPRQHVCVKGGPACCGSGKRFCKKACFR